MRILVCPDSFKGSLTASQAASAIKEGLLKSNPDFEIVTLPLADGGEGTLECFKCITKAETVNCETENIFFKKMTGCFLKPDCETAFIETATASGLTTVEKSELNPLEASARGTGILIKKAIDGGAKKIILALGGSATNDGGTGVLNALGVDFLDENGKAVMPTGGNMLKVKEIAFRKEFEKYSPVKFTLACDVENPFYGKDGAAYVFASQKGADENGVELLDRGLRNIERIYENYSHKHIQSVKGTGAAGGLCGGIYAFFDSEIKPCFDLIREKSDLDGLIENADLVITGEGRTDYQTAFGKLPARISAIAKDKNKRCILISGDIEDGLDTAKMGFKEAYRLKNDKMTLEFAVKNAYNLLVETAKDIEVG